MTQVLQYLRHSGGAFDPGQLNVLGAAYDLAVSLLKEKASPEVRHVIAGRIIEAGMDGQNDVKALCALALRGFATP